MRSLKYFHRCEDYRVFDLASLLIKDPFLTYSITM
jgi:hypothetical protein